jgi:hypothetical protein
MAVEIIPLELGVTAWREIINYNFALMNAQAGGIPLYTTKPTSKKEDLIFVFGTGFMEWNTTISPNAYTKNLILTTADLQAFANGTSSIKLTYMPVLSVQAGTYPIYLQNFQTTHPNDMLTYYAVIGEAVTSHTMMVSGTIRATFRGNGGQGSNDNTTIQLYKNDEPLGYAYNTADRSMDVSVVAGDIIECRTTAGTSGVKFLRLTASLESVTRILHIAVPANKPYVINIRRDYNS